MFSFASFCCVPASTPHPIHSLEFAPIQNRNDFSRLKHITFKLSQLRFNFNAMSFPDHFCFKICNCLDSCSTKQCTVFNKQSWNIPPQKHHIFYLNSINGTRGSFLVIQDLKNWLNIVCCTSLLFNYISAFCKLWSNCIDAQHLA